jgi:hypothetical protein
VRWIASLGGALVVAAISFAVINSFLGTGVAMVLTALVFLSTVFALGLGLR